MSVVCGIAVSSLLTSFQRGICVFRYVFPICAIIFPPSYYIPGRRQALTVLGALGVTWCRESEERSVRAVEPFC